MISQKRTRTRSTSLWGNCEFIFLCQTPMNLILAVFKTLVLLLGFYSLVVGCQPQNQTPAPIVINGIVTDTTGKRVSGFRFEILGYNRKAFTVLDITDSYPIQSDSLGRYTQKIAWDKSTDYYAPNTTLYSPPNSFIVSCSGDKTLEPCKISRPNDFRKEQTYTVNIVIGQF